MPKNKNALIRYRVINRCLLDYKYVSKVSMIQKQFYYDAVIMNL